jgi:30S ribosomal protein S31
MGKGDRRSRRGKIWRGTHGKTRPKKRKVQKPEPAPAKKKTPSRTRKTTTK